MRDQSSFRLPFWVKLLWLVATVALAYRLAIAAGWL